MHKQYLLLSLVDDLVFSARSATLGGHRALDYIPGANLLGVAAARLYEDMPTDKACTVFHSGQVRFGNGLPFSFENGEHIPMAMCFHQKKSNVSLTAKSSKLALESTLNYMHQTFDEGVQAKQLRKGYLSLNRELYTPKTQLQMKTAVDNMTGMAENQQLFGYQSLVRGQHFIAYIEADEKFDGDASTKTFSQIVEALTGPIRLGRSRNSEYGRVSVEPIDYISWANQHDLVGNTTLTLWLLSDLAAIDEFGEPCLAPQPQHLGLPAGILDQEKTFIRTRNYSPYNGKYRRFEMERQVISAGSVLHFCFENPLTDADANVIEGGLGLYRQQGLGRVWANPSVLTNQDIDFTALKQDNNLENLTTKTNTVRIPNLPIARWIENQMQGGLSKRKDRDWAYTLADSIEELYIKARAYNGFAATIPCGPSATQWGRIHAAATNTSKEKLSAVLENDICKSNDTDWNISCSPDLTFRQWIIDELLNTKKYQPNDFCYVVRTLSHRVQSRRSQEVQ